MRLPIANRQAAGQSLAAALDDYRGRDDIIVLALPRGGVPVALEVARALAARLDLMIVRKLGTPGQAELAMGAIASGGSSAARTELVRTMDSVKTADPGKDRFLMDVPFCGSMHDKG